MSEWASYSVPINIPLAWPQFVSLPADRRHKWRLTSEGKDYRWFRCPVCGKRKRMTHVVALIGAKMHTAQRDLEDYLTADLWGRRPPRTRKPTT